MQIHAINNETVQLLTPNGEIVLWCKSDAEILVQYLTHWMAGTLSELPRHPIQKQQSEPCPGGC